MILLDSDHLSILMERRDARRLPLLERLAAAADNYAVPIAVAEEQLRAWLAKIRRVNNVHEQIVPYIRLGKAIDFFMNCSVAASTSGKLSIILRLQSSMTTQVIAYTLFSVFWSR